MRHIVSITLASLVLVGFQAGSGSLEAAAATGELAPAKDGGSVKKAHGAAPSKIKATKTEAALKLVVVDKEKGPIPGITISVTGKDGKKHYAPATDAAGYTELLVPVGQEYNIVYLSLGMSETAATLPITSEPNQSIRLTLRYTKILPPPGPKGRPPGIVLSGITFDTGKSTIRPASFAQLDGVVEYMAHKPGAKVEISGHTDNVGDAKANKTLSQKRAQACLEYLVSKGIDKSRLTAVGYGDERPVAPNGTPDGREKNRRIEAVEL